MKTITQSRIARKMAGTILVSGLLITLGLTLIQLAIEYRLYLSDIQKQVEAIKSGYLPSLTQSLWVYDDDMTQAQLDGLLNLQGIAYAAIVQHDCVIFQAGQPVNEGQIEEKFILRHAESDISHDIGILQVVHDLGDVYAKMKISALQVIATNILVVGIVSTILLILFHLLVSRRLFDLSRELSEIQPVPDAALEEKGINYPGGKAPDEIQQVTNATAIMKERINSVFTTLRSSENRYRKLISEMSAGFALYEMIYDTSGRSFDYRFLEVNPAFEKLTGLHAGEIKDKTARELFPGKPPRLLDVYDKVTSSGVATSMETYSKKLGKYHEYIVYRPEDKKVAVLLTDISDRKRFEQKEAEAKKILEHNVRERTKDLEARMADSDRLNQAMTNLLEDLKESNQRHEALSGKLAEANKELEAFTYSVSHDLRAPLRGIDGFSKALVEDCSSDLDEQGLHYIDRVRKATLRMGQLIDDLLRLSRVSRAELKKMPVNLSSITRDIAQQLRQTFSKRNIHIKVAENVTVKADPNLIHIVMENLLGNAFKFTGKKKIARIEFGCELRPDHTMVWLKDSGDGFDMQFFEKLFGPFERLHRTDEFEGTGIGLSIVKRIITRHNGRVWAESTRGKGASFFFTIPAEKEK